MNADTIEQLKARWSVPEVWRLLGLPGEPGRDCCSPFRDEKKPSFSIYADGRKWKDHASGEGGDIFDLIGTSLRFGNAEAVSWLRKRNGRSTPKAAASPNREKPTPKRYLPPLRLGTGEELAGLGSLRSLQLPGLHLAQDRGILRFTTWAGSPAWSVTDGCDLAEFRRLDGHAWQAYGPLPERKAHCVAVRSGAKNKPVGISAADQFKSFLLVEGAPDALAAHDLIERGGIADKTGVLAILGGTSRIDPDTAERLSGRRVRIIPHADEAGRTSLQRWSGILTRAGALVDAYLLEDLLLPSGGRVKDLNDALTMDPDAVVKLVREVIP